MGRAKFTLLSVLAVAATNLRLTERWREHQERTRTAPTAPRPKRLAARAITSLVAHTVPLRGSTW